MKFLVEAWSFTKNKLQHRLPRCAIHRKAFMFIGMTSSFTKNRLPDRLCHYKGLNSSLPLIVKVWSFTKNRLWHSLCHCHLLWRFHIYRKCLKPYQKQTLKQNLSLSFIVKAWSFTKNRLCHCFKLKTELVTTSSTNLGIAIHSNGLKLY